MNKYLMPKGNGSHKLITVDQKRLIKILFLMTLILCVIFLFFSIYQIAQNPNYIYRDFTWSPTSSYISYIRIPLKHDTDKNLSCILDHEIWTYSFDSNKKRKIATFKGIMDTIIILGWKGKDERIFVEKDENDMKVVYDIHIGGNKIVRYNLGIPGLKKILYDKGTLFTIQDSIDGRNKTIGFLHEGNFSFKQLLNFELKERESLDLLSAKMSNQKDKIALGIYYSPQEEDPGSTHIWVCDINKKKLSKLEIQSHGKYISFEWAPTENLIAACVAEKDETDQLRYTISFHELYINGRFDKLTTSDLNKSLSLFWNLNNKLFLIMKDTIYLMLLNPEPVAKPILSWNSLGYLPTEFAISPDGSKIVFHSVTSSPKIKDDVYIIDIDGTHQRRLLEPEGSRYFERTIPYKFFITLKRVLLDLRRALIK